MRTIPLPPYRVCCLVAIPLMSSQRTTESRRRERAAKARATR